LITPFHKSVPKISQPKNEPNKQAFCALFARVAYHPYQLALGGVGEETDNINKFFSAIQNWIRSLYTAL
jgi:hypothetical protein